jgi:hypothetical protein
VLKTLQDKEPFYWLAGFWKKRVIVSWAGRRHWVMVFPVPTLRYRWSYRIHPFNEPIVEEHSQDFFGSSFLSNPGWDSRWFHRPEAARPGFSPRTPGLGRTFEDSLQSEFTKPRL